MWECSLSYKFSSQKISLISCVGQNLTKLFVVAKSDVRASPATLRIGKESSQTLVLIFGPDTRDRVCRRWHLDAGGCEKSILVITPTQEELNQTSSHLLPKLSRPRGFTAISLDAMPQH